MVASEPTDRVILDIRISFERTILVAEKFLKDLIKKYGKHPLSTDMVVELGILKLADS